MTEKELLVYRHNIGDGLHYITKGYTGGETSELCILLNLELVLFRHRVGTLEELWTAAYPEDPMSLYDVGRILCVAVAFCDRFNANIPDNIADVLSDVRSMQCHELADLVEVRLRAQGVVF